MGIMGPPRIKGLSFVTLRKFVEQRFDGAEGWGRLMEKLSAEDRAVVASAAGNGWYDLALLARTLNALDHVFGTGDFAIIRQNGIFQAEHDLKLVFRMFFRMASPSFVITKTTEYWRRHHTAGVWEIERESSQRVRGRLTDWGVDAALCASLSAYMKRLIQLVGGKDVILQHPDCRVTGQPACVFTLQWRE